MLCSCTYTYVHTYTVQQLYNAYNAGSYFNTTKNRHTDSNIYVYKLQCVLLDSGWSYIYVHLYYMYTYIRILIRIIGTYNYEFDEVIMYVYTQTQDSPTQALHSQWLAAQFAAPCCGVPKHMQRPAVHSHCISVEVDGIWNFIAFCLHREGDGMENANEEGYRNRVKAEPTELRTKHVMG